MKRLIALLCLTATPAWACDIQLTEGWVREAPPGVPMLAGYGLFKNTGKSELTLGAIRSPQFGVVEMHETTMQNGQMQMRELPPLRLAPGAEVRLEPGAKHLMLMEPAAALRAGDSVELSFDCGSQRPLKVRLPVKSAP